MPLLLALLRGRRSLVGCTGAELPQLLGTHGSFVRASDVGSGHPASRSHLCKGTISPGCQRSRPAIGKRAPASPGHPCHQLQLPCPSPPGPLQLQAKGLRACSISGHAALSVPTASRAGGGCRHAGREFGPCEPFVQSHLPAPGY